jgi:hypothetical protein
MLIRIDPPAITVLLASVSRNGAGLHLIDGGVGKDPTRAGWMILETEHGKLN